MTNFIFKSQEATYKKLDNQLKMVLSELRHQRTDHNLIVHQINKLLINANLQKQVDDYFDEPDNVGESPDSD